MVPQSWKAWVFGLRAVEALQVTHRVHHQGCRKKPPLPVEPRDIRGLVNLRGQDIRDVDQYVGAIIAVDRDNGLPRRRRFKEFFVHIRHGAVERAPPPGYRTVLASASLRFASARSKTGLQPVALGGTVSAAPLVQIFGALQLPSTQLVLGAGVSQTPAAGWSLRFARGPGPVPTRCPGLHRQLVDFAGDAEGDTGEIGGNHPAEK